MRILKYKIGDYVKLQDEDPKWNNTIALIVDSRNTFPPYNLKYITGPSAKLTSGWYEWPEYRMTKIDKKIVDIVTI